MGQLEVKNKNINRVLIVDDNIDIRLLFKKRLETEGYEVLEAENGLEATNSIQDKLPCLVILDLMMPVMDGWQFLEWKKEQKKEVAELPVIVISAVSNNIKAPEGVAGFLKKPVSLNSIISTIENYC